MPVSTSPVSTARSRPLGAATSFGESSLGASAPLGSVPSSVRLPPRYAAAAAAAARRAQHPQLDPLQVKRAFNAWDADTDGKVDANDLLRHAEACSLHAPIGGWKKKIELMIAEAVQRTGFARSVGKVLKPGESVTVTLPDVRAAAACRVHARSKVYVPRPHRDVWIILIRSALPDAQCFAQPHPLDEMFRERNDVQGLLAESLRRPHTSQHEARRLTQNLANASTSSFASTGLFQGLVTRRPVTVGSGPPRRARNRADGLQYSVSPTIDPHLTLAAELSVALSSPSPGFGSSPGVGSSDSLGSLLGSSPGSFLGSPGRFGTADLFGGSVASGFSATDTFSGDQCSFSHRATHDRLGRQIETWSTNDFAAVEAYIADQRSAADDGRTRAATAAGPLSQPRWENFFPRNVATAEAQREAAASTARRPEASPIELRGRADFTGSVRPEAMQGTRVRLSELSNRVGFGKSHQASFGLAEAQPYFHTTRPSDDSAGWDKRSRLVRDHRSDAAGPKFITHLSRAKPPPIISVVQACRAGVDYDALVKEGSRAYERNAVHPVVKNDPYTPSSRMPSHNPRQAQKTFGTA